MSISNLSAVANDTIQSFGKTAVTLIGAWRAGGNQMLSRADSGWETIVDRRASRLSLKLRQDMIAAQREIFGYYAKGFEKLTSRSASAVHAVVNAASTGVERLSNRVASLEVALKPVPLNSAIVVAQPFAEAGREIAEFVARRAAQAAWLLRRFTETLRPFADAHESVEAIDDLWLTMHLTMEAIDQYRFIPRDVDFLVREFPALLIPLRELTAHRIAAMHAVLAKLRALGVLGATDEQLASLTLHTVLTHTAWYSFENLLTAASNLPLRGSRAAAYHLLVMISPYVSDESRKYLDYLRSRYTT